MRVRSLGAGPFERSATPPAQDPLRFLSRGLPHPNSRVLIHPDASRLESGNAQPRPCSSTGEATTKHHELVREFDSARR